MYWAAQENDILVGGVHDDGLYGGDDDDRVYGGAGDDDLRMTFMGSFIGAGAFTAVGQVRYDTARACCPATRMPMQHPEWTIQMTTGLVLTAGDFLF